ncbi:hypothetical protein B0H11DRAFT_2159494 [Mycena galericulata]|nr:hypothetical protein B0H11DRAFT_2159494 [Mycena galericulata]
MEPPSPMKRLRRSLMEPVEPPAAVKDPLIFDDAERYSMSMDHDDDGAGPSLPPPTKRQPKTTPSYLQESLRRDGPGDASVDSCANCISSPGTIRCRDCFGDLLYCDACIVKMHEFNPLHVIDRWTGKYYVPVTLKDLGLRVQLGHTGCLKPRAGHENFVVLDLGSIHTVNVDFCGCDKEYIHGPHRVQLLRRGWFPATVDSPRTCATFRMLNFFHTQTLQSKTTMYDFYTALERLTNAAGVKPPNRYRDGRVAGTIPRALTETGLGDLAVRCPACPRPGINLPDDWEKAPPERKFLYIFFLALDACFRLKRRLVSSDLRDPGLGTGWAYFVETEPYRKFLLTVTDQDEMSTCSGLAALDYANTKFSRGYAATGVGMGVCARHEFVQPNGVGDLQKGERFANMDWIFACILRHLDERLFKIISYDIACQWWKKLRERLMMLPPHLRLLITMALLRFVIPKMHINSHTLACRILYALSYLLGAAQTDGEGIERPWSFIGAVATSTREMGPGSRFDVLDDHWAFWNWCKLITLAQLLRRRLDNAKAELVSQRESFEAFSAEQAERVPEWRKRVEAFEADPTKPNPYEIKVKGLTEAEVRLQFSREEERRVEAGLPSVHDVSASSFICAGLQLEEQQRRVRVQAELKKAHTTGQEIDLIALRRPLVRGIQRFRTLQATYTPAALQALAKRPVAQDEVPEDTPLMLPSALTPQERESGGCVVGLLEMEDLMRDAQCATALVHLRNQLHIKSRLVTYKRLHSRHQGANTRSRSIVARNESKIRLHSESGKVDAVGWLRLKKEDIRLMEDAEELSKDAAKKKRREQRQKAKVAELMEIGELPTDADEEDRTDDEGVAMSAAAGESRREVSWIWTVAGTTGTDEELEDALTKSFSTALRIEWSKAFARVRRWTEEAALLEEEYRRILVSFEYEASIWDGRAASVPISTVPDTRAQGAVAYAHRQAAIGLEWTRTDPQMRGNAKIADPVHDVCTY